MLLEPAHHALMRATALASEPPAGCSYFRVMTPLFAEVDGLTMSFARDVSSRLIAAIAPVVSAGLALWFVAWSIAIITGVVDQPVSDFLRYAIRISLVVSVALSAGFYQANVAELVASAPDDLAAVVMGGERSMEMARPGATRPGCIVSLGPEAYDSRQAAVIDLAVGLGLAKAGDAFEKAGLFSGQGIGFALMGGILMLATIAMGGIGAAFILMAKVTLAILAGLGPLFIVALLFERTKHFFGNWLSMVATYGLVIVVIATVFTFLLAIFGNYMTGVSFDGVINVAYAVGGSAILALISILVLWEAKTLAVGLGGGHAHEMGRGLLLFMTLKALNRNRPTPPPPPPPPPSGAGGGRGGSSREGLGAQRVAAARQGATVASRASARSSGASGDRAGAPPRARGAGRNGVPGRAPSAPPPPPPSPGGSGGASPGGAAGAGGASCGGGAGGAVQDAAAAGGEP